MYIIIYINIYIYARERIYYNSIIYIYKYYNLLLILFILIFRKKNKQDKKVNKLKSKLVIYITLI